MNSFIDQLNRKIELPFTPKRIISLVPSQTELLFDLGLGDKVVGITKFCIHPNEWFRSKARVGGTKKIDFAKIKQLQPDLIIGNKEENEKEQIEELINSGICEIWMSDIFTLKDALQMITNIGTIVGKQKESTRIKLQIESEFQNLSALTSNTSNINTAYFIWRDPYMVAGNNTFINDMLLRCGFNTVFFDGDLSRYPQVNIAQIAEANPELILLSSEPYPFKEKHIQEFRAICPNAKIMIVDGEMFSWYGSRLLQAPNYFQKLRMDLGFSN